MKKNNSLKIIGNEIRKIRNEMNISLSYFAKSINMQSSYLKSIENGCININLRTLIKICDALNKDIAEFIKGTDL